MRGTRVLANPAIRNKGRHLELERQRQQLRRLLHYKIRSGRKEFGPTHSTPTGGDCRGSGGSGPVYVVFAIADGHRAGRGHVQSCERIQKWLRMRLEILTPIAGDDGSEEMREALAFQVPEGALLNRFVVTIASRQPRLTNSSSVDFMPANVVTDASFERRCWRYSRIALSSNDSVAGKPKCCRVAENMSSSLSPVQCSRI